MIKGRTREIEKDLVRDVSHLANHVTSQITFVRHFANCVKQDAVE